MKCRSTVKMGLHDPPATPLPSASLAPPNTPYGTYVDYQRPLEDACHKTKSQIQIISELREWCCENESGAFYEEMTSPRTSARKAEGSVVEDGSPAVQQQHEVHLWSDSTK